MIARVIGVLFDAIAAALNVVFSASVNRDRRWRAFVDDSALEMPIDAFAPAQGSQAVAPDPLARTNAQIASLQKIDPNFSEVGFAEVASKSYLAALDAENAMNADALGSIATPEFVAWFRQRIQNWRNGGFERTVRDVKILDAKVINVSVDGARQAVKTRFTCTGTRFTKDGVTGIIADGREQEDSFSEFGTFVRPAGATTPPPAGAGAPVHCPSCGAPQEGGAVKCAFCGTPITGSGAAWQLDHLSESAYT